MIRTRPVSIFVGLAVLAGTPILGQLRDPHSEHQSATGVFRSVEHNYRLVTVAENLEHPWAIAFLPGGDVLVTERPGRLRIIRNDTLLPDSVPGVPEVLARGQGGLMDVVPHPDFASNRFLYLSYSKPTGERQATSAVIRGRFVNDTLTDVEEIFVAVSQGNGHYGCRLAFDADGYLFITTGDRQAPPRGDLATHPAQDLSNHHGTVNRIHDDGRVPEDNPFVGREGAQPEIWSYGHRNPQGLVIDHSTSNIWVTEHGPQGGDELNLVLPGRNYGWPVIGFGVNYRSGQAIHEGTHHEGMEQPAFVWVPSIAASGLALYKGDAFPRWRGNLFAGGLAGEKISRFTLDGEEVIVDETLVHRMGRIRDVREGPDGYIYIAIDGNGGEPTQILRLEPADS